MTNETETEIVRLPLWRACLEDMLEEGVSHGKTYSAEFFEQKLRCNREEMQFGLGLSEIRRELEKDGFYLSGRGQKGNQFVILPPESNADVMINYQTSATDALRRAMALGAKTRMELLTNEQRARHEKTLEKIGTRLALIQRSAAVLKVVKQHSPKILTE